MLDHLTQTADIAALLARFPTIARMLSREDTRRLHRLLTPSNIFFHASMLASVTDTPLPPLNIPLAAATSILALGLPAREVWQNLTRMCRVLHLELPHSSLSSIGQHHLEHLLTLLVIACKLTPHWLHWTLERLEKHRTSPDDGPSFPLPQPDGLLIRHGDLSSFLSNVQLVTKDSLARSRPSYRGQFAFNKVVQTIFDSTAVVNFVPHGACAHDFSCSSAALIERTTKGDDRPTAMRSDQRDDGNGDDSSCRRTYLTYCCGDEGAASGSFHAQYIFLVERLARYGCCRPGLLHTLVDNVDVRIVAWAVPPLEPTEVSESDSGPSFRTDMTAPMLYYQEVLPAVQKFNVHDTELFDYPVQNTQSEHPINGPIRRRVDHRPNKVDMAHLKRKRHSVDRGMPFPIDSPSSL